MTYTIYLDLLFLWNLMMDLCILWLTKRLFKYRTSWWRILAGGIAGSGLSVFLQMLRGMPIWAYELLGIAGIGVCMTIITFPVHTGRNLVRYFGSQMIVTVGLGGTLTFLYHCNPVEAWMETLFHAGRQSMAQMFILVIISIVILLLLQEGVERYRMEYHLLRYQGLLSFEGIGQKGVGFVDTGNFLVEPISRQPVVIADAAWLLPMLPEAYQTLVHTYLQQGVIDYDWIAKKQLYKAKWIPYQTIGEECGNLLGIQCCRLVLHCGDSWKSYSPVMIGVSHTSVGKHMNYQFILPEALVRDSG